MMLVPLLLGAVLNTTAPDTGNYFGSFTKGMIGGTVPITAVWFFCIGASIDLRATGTVLRKSGTLVITKIAVARIVAFIAAMVIPEKRRPDRFLCRTVGVGNCLGNGYDQRWPVRQPDESVRQ